MRSAFALALARYMTVMAAIGMATMKRLNDFNGCETGR